MLALVDFLIPNETEAALLAGMPADALASGEPAEAERIADKLLEQGARTVVLTLGSRGSLLRTADRQNTWISAVDAGPVLGHHGRGRRVLWSTRRLLWLRERPLRLPHASRPLPPACP